MLTNLKIYICAIMVTKRKIFIDLNTEAQLRIPIDFFAVMRTFSVDLR
jgi:hypothetical protein